MHASWETLMQLGWQLHENYAFRFPIVTANIGTHQTAMLETRQEQKTDRRKMEREDGERRRKRSWWEMALNIGTHPRPRKRFDCTGVGTSPSSRMPSILVRMCPFPDCHLAFTWCHGVAYFRTLHVQGSSTLLSSSPLLPSRYRSEPRIPNALAPQALPCQPNH